MIISCPNCNKKFKIDQNLIPIGGRLLQCSNCKHKWHFKIEKKDEIDDGLLESDKIILENKSENTKINSTENNSLIEDNSEKELKKKDKPINIINMIIVIIISVAALIIFIDTFRIELSKYMPFLNPMFDSFYEIIADINSFIKDLIR